MIEGKAGRIDFDFFLLFKIKPNYKIILKNRKITEKEHFANHITQFLPLVFFYFTNKIKVTSLK